MTSLKHKVSVLTTLMSVVIFYSSCGSDSDMDASQTVAGLTLFEQPHSDGNSFACATCHAVSEPTEDGLVRAGHPIGDAFSRSSFKNGKISTLFEAVNSCRTEWMGAPAWEATTESWKSLEAWLKMTDSAKAGTTISYNIVSPPTELNGGDHTAGGVAYKKTCIVCHGDGAKGTDRGPSIAGTTLTGQKVAERIRLSGSAESPVYDGLTGGRMPFWAEDRLSDKELLDIIAWLALTESDAEIKNSSETGETVSLSVSDPQDNCGTDHRLVGKIAALSSLAHGVSGTATVVDNCTITLSSFNYDGGGIDVRVYGGNLGAYEQGIPLTINFLGTSFSQGKANFKLPKGITLDDFDGISIWCVTAKVSFGDGLFQ